MKLTIYDNIPATKFWNLAFSQQKKNNVMYFVKLGIFRLWNFVYDMRIFEWSYIFGIVRNSKIGCTVFLYSWRILFEAKIDLILFPKLKGDTSCIQSQLRHLIMLSQSIYIFWPILIQTILLHRKAAVYIQKDLKKPKYVFNL